LENDGSGDIHSMRSANPPIFKGDLADYRYTSGSAYEPVERDFFGTQGDAFPNLSSPVYQQ
jgi:hypothetical protein